MRNKIRKITLAGVMTGTSCDGADIVALTFHNQKGKLCSHWTASASYSYPPKLRQKVLAVQKQDHKISLRDLLLLEREFGDWIASTACDFQKRARRWNIDAYAVHGQTIAHHPQAAANRGPHRSAFKMLPGVTLQMAAPEMVAAATGKTIISNFRDGDLCVGGQGAPLVPLFHRIWASEHLKASQIRKGLVIQNIGGMANFTYLGKYNAIYASDSGPGNALIDWAAEKATNGRQLFDSNGAIASQNPISPALLKTLLQHPYFKKVFPKSTGRDEFSIDWLKSILGNFSSLRPGEVVSTVTELTVQSIVQSYEQLMDRQKLELSHVVLCGGGAKNDELRRRISKALTSRKVEVSSLVGTAGSWDDPQLMEAQAFAYFGLWSLLGRPLGGDWTGARDFGSPGRITPGKNFRELQSKLNEARFYDSK